jgi:hypothetical protein
MRTSSVRRSAVALVSVLALGLGVSACGDDGDEKGDGPIRPNVELATISGKTTAIKLDEGFVKALGDLGLTPGTVGGGRHVKGSLVFPITGGNVGLYTPGEVSPYVIGQLQHEGSGLTLAAGGTTVRLSNFVVDPGISRVYGDVAVNGQTAVTSAYLFRLDGRTLKPVQTEGRFAILEGTKVFISDVAAGLLNKTFGTKAVTDQLLVGVAKITVNTQG